MEEAITEGEESDISIVTKSELNQEEESDSRSIITVESQNQPSVTPKSHLKSRHVRSQSDTFFHNKPNMSSSTIFSRPSSTLTMFSTSFPPLSSENTGTYNEDQAITAEPSPRFMEDGGISIQLASTGSGYLPRPKEGQSLTSFLTSTQFKRACAELDRENAHFSVCEAMIAAIEQVKFTQLMKASEMEEEEGEESDEEIRMLKQRLRIRRRQRLAERQVQTKKSPPASLLKTAGCVLSDGRTEETTTDQDISSAPSSPYPSISPSISSDEELDLGLEKSNLVALRDSGVSVSLASFYSDADFRRPQSTVDKTLAHRKLAALANVNYPVASTPVYSPSQTPPSSSHPSVLNDSVASAESVALSLIRRFNDKQLPKASELEWLVSEQDAPQRLLPLPGSFPVNPDEETENATELRGNLDWAPPRPQIVFLVHPTPNLKVMMAKQNYKCAGCGMRVRPEYSKHFRYCEYLGRYFCTGCHNNNLALIPARILKKWDFTRYPVSNFSMTLLERMWEDPLFHIADMAPALYRRVRTLDKIRWLRIQLFHLRDFIRTCRFAETLWSSMEFIAGNLTDPHLYSLKDLIHVRSGELYTVLKSYVNQAVNHVTQCTLCSARGFLCELCGSSEIIFPFQVDKTTRCDDCGACFHSLCYVAGKCPRCSRLAIRKLQN